MCALPNTSFKRFGRVGTDAKVGYAFDTIKPGVVPDPDGKPQAPHIVLAVFARGMLLHLYTWYFEDEAANANVAKPARSAPLPEQVAIANPDRPDQVTSYDFDVTARCEKLCDQTPPAAVMVNDQVIAGRDVAGDCIDHVVDELAADASARFRSATAAARLASRAARISASLAAACSSSLALTSPTGLPSRSTRAAPATMPFRYITRRA